ncbi:hypothetical protein D0N37_14250 [Pseudoalteromonas piscicida]|nr:hypothetical protein D0N37_14250 [Pseudoalteromonas piscicida]
MCRWQASEDRGLKLLLHGLVRIEELGHLVVVGDSLTLLRAFTALMQFKVSNSQLMLVYIGTSIK